MPKSLDRYRAIVSSPPSVADTEYVPFAEAPRYIPGRPHKNTVIRWSDKGYRGVILESWRIGRRRFTTIDAIDRFLRASTGVHADATPQVSTPAHQIAEAQLDAAGI